MSFIMQIMFKGLKLQNKALSKKQNNLVPEQQVNICPENYNIRPLSAVKNDENKFITRYYILHLCLHTS